MMALFEYEQSICDEPLTVCGTGRSQADGGPCFKRHAEREIPVSALRPPTKFTLIGPVPDDFELTSPDRRGVDRRPEKKVVWRVPAGARQEALSVCAADAKAGINAA